MHLVGFIIRSSETRYWRKDMREKRRGGRR